MILQKNINPDHTARYLVLLNHDDATRALLFAKDHRYLAEVIDDDGLVVDNLMRAGTRCVPPREVAEQTRATSPVKLMCFALDTEH
ncbi:hypothetical protein LRS03_07145 [Rhizobacter sp. J219]|jgi:hypothetical protein|uniref:hypothetical protein n=1 Tax=Rhizobacter sp. J219 TaxID=2898430 RepID=UPI002151C9C0|nr:hypothetical protein [Rhizobacter sp. J219]MCR5882644.1 hypothetical protein [Rhizobacter sp. J219]